MQSVSSRIWTRVAVSISYDDNDYTTGTSSVVYVRQTFSGSCLLRKYSKTNDWIGILGWFRLFTGPYTLWNFTRLENKGIQFTLLIEKYVFDHTQFSYSKRIIPSYFMEGLLLISNLQCYKHSACKIDRISYYQEDKAIILYNFQYRKRNVRWLVGWGLSYINFCRLFNAKSIFMKIILFKTILFSISTQFKCKYSFIVKNISISSYSV